MLPPPTDRVRELERFLARINDAGNAQLGFEGWDAHGREHSSPEYCAQMDADLAASVSAMAAATASLDALVATTRAEAPAEIAAWADAHDAYLAAFLEDCAANGEADGTGAYVATQERAEWAEVRAGTRAWVRGNLFYVTSHDERYRTLFGIDRRTHEDVR